jgi:hypothetical protein
VSEEVDGVIDTELVGKFRQLFAQGAIATQVQFHVGMVRTHLCQCTYRVPGSLALDQTTDEQHDRAVRVDQLALGSIGDEPLRDETGRDDLDARVDAEPAHALLVRLGITEDHVSLVERPPAERPEIPAEHPLRCRLRVQAVIRDGQRNIPQPSIERRQVRREVQVGVGVDHVELVAPGAPEVPGHGRRDLIPGHGHPVRHANNRVPVGLLDARLGRVDSRRQHSDVVTHRRLVATHRVDVVLAAALRVGVKMLGDP